MTLGLVRGIAAGVAAFLTLYFGLKTKLPQEGSAAISYLVALIVYLAIGGGWAAFQRWLNGTEEPEIHGPRRYFDFTTDHKVVGIQYLCAAFFLFFYAGILALIMRTELAKPGEQVLGFQTYNTLVGMHGIGRLTARFDRIHVGGAGLMPLQCTIREIRPLDIKAIRVAEKKAREDRQRAGSSGT